MNSPFANASQKNKIFADMLRKKLRDRSAGPAQQRILGLLSDDHLVELYHENHGLVKK